MSRQGANCKTGCRSSGHIFYLRETTMKKIICVTLALLMLLCTACYPTGEEMVNSIEEIDLFEMNKSDNENITFDFNESPKYEKSYPCFTAKFVEKEKFQEQASQIFLEDQNINDYTIQDNLTSNWNDKENTFTLYKFNLYKDIFNDYNGAFALDNGYIYFDRGGIRKGYETSKSAIDDYKTPENVRKHYADDKTNAVDLETVKTESEDILKSLGFDITSEPEIYVINKKALESISIFKKDQLEIFKEEDEAYLIQYRKSINGLNLPAFNTFSPAKDYSSIDPWVSFIYSKNGIELFSYCPIEIVDKTENKNICSYETAISAAKSYVENTKLYNSEIVNVSGGELNYITEYDYIDHVVNIKPVWIFIKESLFNDRKPFYDSIIIDALTGNKYE